MRALAIDTETTCGKGCQTKCDHGLDFQQAKLLGLGYYGNSGKESGWLTNLNDIKQWLEEEKSKGTVFITHNGKFDQKVLYKTVGVWVDVGFDTLLAASILPDRPPSLKLETVAAKYINVPPWKDENIFRQDTLIETTRDYCLTDCEHTYNTARTLFCRLVDNGLSNFFNSYLLPVGNLLAQVEYNGIALDRSKLESFWKEGLANEQTLDTRLHKTYAELVKEHEQQQLNDKLAKLKNKPKNLARYEESCRFNFKSEKQIKWLLTQKLNIPCVKWDGSISTDRETLDQYRSSHPIVDELIELRKLQHQITYYKQWWEASGVDGRIRSHYNLDVTRTGRLSSSEPNLQNIDRGVARTAFVAGPGKKLVIIDYAQIEPRIAAHYSQDPLLLGAFSRDTDFYSVIIRGMLDLKESPEQIRDSMPAIRSLGKTVGLAILYGIGPNKLANLLSRGSGRTIGYGEAKNYIQKFFDAFPGLRELRQRVAEEILDRGYIENLCGRHVYIKPEDIYHKGVNALIQSSASDLCCKSQLGLAKTIQDNKLDAKLVLLVHDEVVYEVDTCSIDVFKDVAYKHMIEQWQPILKVPLKIEIGVGDNWGAKA